VSIVTPCHRVSGSGGQLTGFAGGLQVKAYLLRLEGARAGALLAPQHLHQVDAAGEPDRPVTRH